MLDQAKPPAALPAQGLRLRDARVGGRIQVVETWFEDEPPSREGFDVWISHQRAQPISPDHWLYFYTIQIDLTQPREALLASMHRNTTRAIKQVEKEGVYTCDFNTAPTAEEVDEFVLLHNSAPRAPGQKLMDWPRVKAMHAAGLLHLNRITGPDGIILIRHAVLVHQQSDIVQVFAHASNLQSAHDSNEANTIGKVHRFLYFQEFLYYKERGFQAYDLNGWYAGTEDGKRLQINKFKESFGGRILYGFECEEALSFKGRAYLWLRNLKWRYFNPEKMKEIRRRRQKAPTLVDA